MTLVFLIPISQENNPHMRESRKAVFYGYKKIECQNDINISQPRGFAFIICQFLLRHSFYLYFRTYYQRR